MKMIVKVHELLKFRDTTQMNEDDIPQIESSDDLESVEEALLDEATKRKLISNIKRFGGSTYVDMVNITLNRLMTVQFQSGLNLCGRFGKIAFGETNLFKTIKTAVSEVFKDSDEKQIRLAIGDHIKGAPDKKGGSGRQKKN
ncbi:uncharacterized protein [Clytia hemisphaerica]|uniref:uncharacterized protein n=1 Tax=Clytia hemisphaerica TaxID=252671 RepID=UPI0034D3F3CF